MNSRNHYARKYSADKPLHVLVIGAGAAGTAACWSLSRFDRYKVTLWEKEEITGGVATTETLPDGSSANVGVQGGAPSYRNTLMMHETLGFSPLWVSMTVAFGKGDTLWGNTQESTSDFMRRMQPEIRKFGTLLKWVYRLEPFSVMMPIGKLLSICGFSQEFSNLMVYPLTALFFGTGNQTPHVAAAIVARVFLDPQLRLFDYDPDRLLTQEAKMFSFQQLGSIYNKLTETLRSRGVQVHFKRPIGKVKRTKSGIEATDTNGKTEHFDEIIFACNSETVLQVLEQPSFLERRCLGAVRYYDDVTITHTDRSYMERHYGADLDNDMYYIHTDEDDASKIEMSFNLANYQPHLKESGHKSLFQTIFLDKKQQSGWTMEQISKDRILSRHWWRQFAHTWTHFAFAVPLVRFIQGNQHTWYAGSWTLINTHEIANISGLAAAARLGAEYPFADDPLAKQFEQYMSIIQGASMDGTPSLSSKIIKIGLVVLVVLAVLLFAKVLFSALA